MKPTKTAAKPSKAYKAKPMVKAATPMKKGKG